MSSLTPLAIGSLALVSAVPTGWPLPSGDTSGARDWAAIQAVLNAAPPTGASGMSYLIPPGTYYFNQHLAINRTTKLVGAGVGSADHLLSSPTQLRFTSTTDDGLKVFAAGCTFEDFAVINATGAEVSGTGILCPFSSYMTMNRVGVSGFYDNVSLDTGIFWQINTCYFLKAVRYGIRVQNTAVADAGDGFIGSGCVFYPRPTGAQSAIRWETGGGLKVEGVKIVSSGAGQWVYGVDASIPDGQATTVLLVNSNSIEGVSDTGIRVSQQGTTGTFGKVIVADNELGVLGAMQTGIAVKSTTVGNITNVLITGNHIPGTVNGIEIQGVNNVLIGDNAIIGTFSDSGISIKDVAAGAVNTNQIVGAFTNAALTIKSSSTPSTDIDIAHQAVSSGSGGQTLILDSSAGVSSLLKRGRIVYDEMRELPAVISNVTYVVLYQLKLPDTIGAAGVLEFSIAGVVTGGAAPDAFAIYGRRVLSLTTAGGASANVTATTIGTDVVVGPAVDYQILCTTATFAYIQVRLNAAQGGTALHGQAHMKYDGTLNRLIRV